MRPPWGWARSHLRLICAGLISTATGPAVAAEPFDRLTNLRDELRNQGFAVAIREVLEGFDNFRGGIQSGRVGASTLEANLAIDTQERLGVPGGKFYVDVQNHAGPDPSTALVGDLQVFDKLNFRPYSQIFELWYQQTLFDNKIRLKIGKVDANTELSHIDNGLYFIHDSAQSSPTIFVFPTTPDPMPGINLFYMPSDLFFISFAVYDANQSDNFLNFSGNPASIQFTRHGQFVIGETGLTWKNFPGLGGDGNLKAGAWGHTGIFERFTGGSQHGAEG